MINSKQRLNTLILTWCHVCLLAFSQVESTNLYCQESRFLSPQSSLSSRPPPANVRISGLEIFPIKGEALQKIIKENPREVQVEAMLRYISFNIDNLIKAREENKRHIYATMTTVLRFWSEGNIILNMPSKDDLDPEDNSFMNENEYLLNKLVIADVGKDPVVNYYADLFIKMISERSLDEEMVDYMTSMTPIADAPGFVDHVVLRDLRNNDLTDEFGKPILVSLIDSASTSTVTGINLGYSLSDINTSYGHIVGDFFISQTGSFLNDMFGKSPTIKFHKYQRTHWVAYNLDVKPSPEALSESNPFFRFPEWSWTEPRDDLSGYSVLEYIYRYGYEGLKRQLSSMEDFPQIMQELLARTGILVHKTPMEDFDYSEFTYNQIVSGNPLTNIPQINLHKLLDRHFQKNLLPLEIRTERYVKEGIAKQKDKGIQIDMLNEDQFTVSEIRSKIKLYSATRNNNATFTRLTQILEQYHKQTSTSAKEALHRLFLETIDHEISFLESKIAELNERFGQLSSEYFQSNPEDFEARKKINLQMNGIKQRRKYIQERVINDIMVKLKDRFLNTSITSPQYLELPTVQEFLTNKTQLLPVKIREVENRFLKELQWRSTTPSDNANYDRFYAGTNIVDDYQGRAELTYRSIKRNGKEGNIHTPQRDFSAIIELFRDMEEDEIFKILKSHLKPDSDDDLVDDLHGAPFWQLFREKSKNERDDLYVDPYYFYKHTALAIEYYRKGAKDMFIKNILGLRDDDSPFEFIFSKAGDELRAFVIDKNNPDNVRLLNVDFKHFQDFDILTEELGIKTLDDEAYHQINQAFVSGIREAFLTNPNSPTLGKDSITKAREHLLGPNGVSLHLNRNQNTSEKHFIRVVTYLQKQLNNLNEDRTAIREKRYYDLHYFEDVRETRGEVSDETLISRLNDQQTYLSDKLAMIRKTTTTILELQSKLSSIPSETEFKSPEEIEAEIFTLSQDPQIWSLQLAYVFYGSKTKDITKERVENPFHTKTVGFYAASKSVSLPRRATVDDIEKALESELIESDNVLELSKNLGEHNVAIDQNEIDKTPLSTPTTKHPLLTEQFLNSEQGLEFLETLQQVLSNQFPGMFSGDKNDQLKKLKTAMLKFLHSTRPLGQENFFLPQMGRVLHPVSIAREWQKIFPTMPFSVDEDNQAYAAYTVLENMILSSYYKDALKFLSYPPKMPQTAA